MFGRIALLLFMYYMTTNPLYGQVVFQGPTTGKVGKLNTVVVTEVKGNDFKLIVLKNGLPAAQTDYLSLKNEDNQRVIMILTDDEGLFTLIGATNSENKTLTSIHTMQIGSPAPPKPVDPVVPKPVDPVIPTNDLRSRLQTKYNVSPDKAALTKLIAIFDEISKEKYANADAAESDLTKMGQKFLQDGDLRAVRDEISKYLLEKHGTDSRNRKTDAMKVTYAEIATVLKGL